MRSTLRSVSLLSYLIVLPVEKPQNRPGNNHPVMLPLRRILGVLQLLPIFLLIDTSRLEPHLNLSMHHVLVESQMALRGEQAPPDIHALHLGRLASTPHMDVPIVLLGEKMCGG